MISVSDYVVNVMPGMNGWCTAEKALSLALAVKSENPKVCVEIGVFAGRSLFAMGLGVAEINLMAEVWGVDPWDARESIAGFDDENARWWGSLDHESVFRECVRLMTELGLANICRLLRMTSAEALKFFKYYKSIDLLSLDGNHSEESSCFDVTHYVPLVSRGGLIYFDDSDWKQTKEAQLLLATMAEKEGNVGACAIYRKR